MEEFWFRRGALSLLHVLKFLKQSLTSLPSRLLVTGSPHEDVTGDEHIILRNLLRDGGLFSIACPAFISIKGGLKKLSVGEYKHQVVRAQKDAGFQKRSSTQKATKAPMPVHPEGGKPPKSSYTAGTTVWKWAKEEDDGERQWIEFHRESGRLMSEVDLEDEEEDDDPFWLPPLGALPPFLIPQTAIYPPESDLSEFEESDDEMPERLNNAAI